MSWLSDTGANKYKKSYFNGFIDVNGGDIIQRNNDIIIGATGCIKRDNAQIVATNNEYVTKSYVDNSYVKVSNNNAWAGTNSFNTSFPTSSLPSSTAVTVDSIMNKAKLDTLYQLISGMSSYLTTSTASSTYQTIANMSSYLTTATASSTYQTIANMSSYLTTANASSTYQTIANMSSYLTTANASSTYVKVANNNVWTGTNAFNTSYPTSTLPSSTTVTVDSIMNKAKIDSLYQTIANMSNYLTTASASSTYQTIANMTNYLTTATASTTYVKVANNNVWTGTNAFNTSYPTSTLPSSTTVTADSIMNKAKLDTLYAPFGTAGITLAQVQANNNVWTGTNSFSSAPVMSGASITSGTIPNSALQTSVALKNVANTFTGSITCNGFVASATAGSGSINLAYSGQNTRTGYIEFKTDTGIRIGYIGYIPYANATQQGIGAIEFQAENGTTAFKFNKPLECSYTALPTFTTAQIGYSSFLSQFLVGGSPTLTPMGVDFTIQNLGSFSIPGIGVWLINLNPAFQYVGSTVASQVQFFVSPTSASVTNYVLGSFGCVICPISTQTIQPRGHVSFIYKNTSNSSVTLYLNSYYLGGLTNNILCTGGGDSATNVTLTRIA